MEGSTSQLLSQIPYTTQLPMTRNDPAHSSSQSSRLFSVPSSLTAGHALSTIPQIAVDRATQSQKEAEAFGNGSSATSLEPREAASNDKITVDYIPSSEESIDCRPFVPAAHEEQPAPVLTVSTCQDSRPFPLIHWIKKIRRETPRQWPIVSLRWARTVSSKQKAILDTDDAWVPSLAGKPARQGTVPIDILDFLTTKADHQSKNESIVQPEYLSQHNLTPSKPTPEPVTTPPSQESHTSTVEASQWSPSPTQHRQRRRQLPPDTSPIKDLYSAAMNNLQQQPRASCQDGVNDHGEDQPILLTTKPEREASTDDVDACASEIEDVAVLESPSKMLSNDEIAQTSAAVAESSVIDDKSTTNDSAEDLRHIPSSLIGSQPRIHVEDTPYPLGKGITPRRESINTDDPPHSSFVGATYPDQRSNTSERAQDTAAKSDQPCSRSGTPSQFTYRTHAVSARPTVRPDQHVTNPSRSEDTCEKEAVGISGHKRKITHGNRLDTLPLNKRPRLVGRTALHPPAGYVDPDYHDIDQRRLLEGREFRKSISKDQPAVHLQQRRGDRPRILAFSPPSSDEHGATNSGYRIPSATKFSVQHSSSIKAPSTKLGSRRSSFGLSFGSQSLSLVFSGYMKEYPEYPGNEKSFTAALRLLLKLQAQPHEPHPSLWDDFIYRYADDYQHHLKSCMTEFENPLPYQDFYHLRIKRAGRKADVVTQEVLRQLLYGNEDLTGNYHNDPRESLPICHDTGPINDSDVELTDVQSQLQPERIENPLTSTIPETQVPLERSVGVTLDTHKVVTTTGWHAATHTTSVLATNKSAQKRRSLPWATNKTAASSSLAHGQVKGQNNSQGSNHTGSSKVEEWLGVLGNRAAGAVSPELEANDLPAQVGAGVIVARDGGAHEHQVTVYASTEGRIVKNVDSSNDVHAMLSTEVCKPRTKFSSFVRKYTSIQPGATSVERTPINIYSW